MLQYFFFPITNMNSHLHLYHHFHDMWFSKWKISSKISSGWCLFPELWAFLPAFNALYGSNRAFQAYRHCWSCPWNWVTKVVTAWPLRLVKFELQYNAILITMKVVFLWKLKINWGEKVIFSTWLKWNSIQIQCYNSQ